MAGAKAKEAKESQEAVEARQAIEEAQVDAVVKAITERLGKQKLVCPLSGDDQWHVEPYFAAIPAYKLSGAPSLPGPAFPFTVLSCKTCGFSFFVNLIRLGLADALDIPVAE